MSDDINKKLVVDKQHVDSIKAAKAPNPFDLDRLALPQSFAEAIGVRELLTHVPVGKPGNQDWHRVHPDGIPAEPAGAHPANRAGNVSRYA
jgi:hypothetical protein